MKKNGGDQMDTLKILVVDDESRMRKLVRDFLVKKDFEVLEAGDGEEALDVFYNEKNIALVILDVMMPKMDGIEVLAKLRGSGSTVPIIMLTAKSEDSDKIMGFACGADDYVTKPFNIMELKARIRALLRRSTGARRREQESSRIACGDFVLDMGQRVALCGGRVVDLTAKEYDLLEVLMKNPRRVFSREKLMDQVWGYTYAGDYRTVDVHIRRLREKLEGVSNQWRLKTVWGVGYKFETR